MSRRISALVAVGALALALLNPADAVAKKKPRPAVMTQFLNWGGDCAGAGYLALEHVPNPDSCALFFPGLGSEYYFAGEQGMPFVLDADKAATLDFSMSTVVTAAAEFDAVLSATVDGEQVEVASATASVTAATTAQGADVHFDLQPAAELDNAKVSALSLTVTWTDGVTYSSIDLDSGTAQLVLYGFK